MNRLVLRSSARCSQMAPEWSVKLSGYILKYYGKLLTEHQWSLFARLQNHHFKMPFCAVGIRKWYIPTSFPETLIFETSTVHIYISRKVFNCWLMFTNTKNTNMNLKSSFYHDTYTREAIRKQLKFSRITQKSGLSNMIKTKRSKVKTKNNLMPKMITSWWKHLDYSLKWRKAL